MEDFELEYNDNGIDIFIDERNYRGSGCRASSGLQITYDGDLLSDTHNKNIDGSIHYYSGTPNITYNNRKSDEVNIIEVEGVGNLKLGDDNKVCFSENSTVNGVCGSADGTSTSTKPSRCKSFSGWTDCECKCVRLLLISNRMLIGNG